VTDHVLGERRIGDQQRSLDPKRPAGLGQFDDAPGAEAHPGRIAPVGAEGLRINRVHASVSSARRLRRLMVQLSSWRKPPSCAAAMASVTERALILDFGVQYTS
jgi:hypothetical protein